jgi:hypothetical protein
MLFSKLSCKISFRLVLVRLIRDVLSLLQNLSLLLDMSFKADNDTHFIKLSLQVAQHILLDHHGLVVKILDDILMSFGIYLDDDRLDGRITLDQDT